MVRAIFNTPKTTKVDNGHGVEVMFLHGLEGSSSGTKAKHLSDRWGAICPPLRTVDLIQKRDECAGNWNLVEQNEKDEGMMMAYEDAVEAVRYANPDVIVGSSMGAALLFRLIAEEKFTGTAVFCTPAIKNLLGEETIKTGLEKLREQPNVWLLGELDTVVSNKHNMSLAKEAGGSVVFSPEDGHRLEYAVSAGLLDAVVLTGFELYAENEANTI